LRTAEPAFDPPRRAGGDAALQHPIASSGVALHNAQARWNFCRLGGRMIYVVATIQLTPGGRADFLAEQRHLLPLVRAEKGCLEYVPSVDVAMTDPPKAPLRDDVVVMHEKWESLDSLKAHFAARHMLQFREKVKHLIHSTKVEVFEAT
jgi:quinol monooxygenase YgiN